MKKLIIPVTLFASLSISVTVLPTATAQQGRYLAPFELSGSCEVSYDGGQPESAPWGECYDGAGRPHRGVVVTTGPRGQVATRHYVTAGSVPNTGFYANNTGFHPGTYANYAPVYQGQPQVVYGGQPQGYAVYPQGNGYPPGYQRGPDLGDILVGAGRVFLNSAAGSAGNRFGDKMADDWLGIDPNDHRPSYRPPNNQYPHPGGQPPGQRMCYNNQSPELFPCPN